MDTKQPKKLRHGNCLQRLFFTDTMDLIKIANQKIFSEEDFRKIDEDYYYKNNVESFLEYYQKHRESRSIFMILISWFFGILSFRLIAGLLTNSTIFVLPFILRGLINWLGLYFNDPSSANTMTLVKLISFLGVFLFLRSLLLFQAINKINDIIIKMFPLFLGMLFKKLRKLDPRAKKHLDVGEITNNMTNDLFRVQITFALLYELVGVPILFLALNILLVYMFGAWIVFGFFVLYFNFFIVTSLGFMSSRMTKKKMALNDLRNKEMIFSLQEIQNIKLNGLEDVVSDRISNIRIKEREIVWKIQFIKSTIDILIFLMPTLSGFVCIMTYYFIGSPLDLEDCFFLITSFAIISGPLKNFCYCIVCIIDCKNSLQRLDFLMELPEVPEEEEKTNQESSVGLGVVRFENYYASYQSSDFDKKILKSLEKYYGKHSAKYQKLFTQMKTNEETYFQPMGRRLPKLKEFSPSLENSKVLDDKFRLQNINFETKPGEITMIVGPIGSGKSSLLKSLINNLHYESGKVTKKGSIAYIPQNSVLINASIKQNVIFGLEENERRYKESIKMSQMKSDLEILTGKDQTEVGARGINLSGGQKQRISIARAFYSDSDIYLIDDALSALDINVGKKIFDKMIIGNLIKERKSIVMTTHLLQFLPQADNILYMEKGKILAQGTFEELKQYSKNFCEFIMEKEEEEKNKEEVKDEYDPIKEELIRRNSLANMTKSNISLAQINSIKRMSELKIEGELTKKEKLFEGKFQDGMFAKFVAFGGRCNFSVFLIILFVTMLLKISSDAWIGVCLQNSYNMNGLTKVLGYTALIVSVFIFGFLRSFNWAAFTSNISFNNFKNLVENILKKPMKFFDTTSVGQILNLTGSDTEIVESILFDLANYICISLLLFVGSMCLVAYSNILLSPFIILVVIVFSYFSEKYIRLCKELRRLELVCYSPIISNIVEVFEGGDQFRAYGQFDWQEEKFASQVDDIVIAKNHIQDSLLCFNLYVDFLAQFFIVFIVISVLAGVIYEFESSTSSTTVIAVTFSWIFNIPNFIFMLAMNYCEMIQYFSSFERTAFTIDSEVSEKPKAKYAKEPKDPQWPSYGKIEFKNIKCRYRDNLPLVLDGVSFTVNPNEKVAIVGRTGAGKSSLLLLLSRILEVENNPNYPPIARSQKIETREAMYDTARQSMIVIDFEKKKETQDQIEVTGDTKHFNLLEEIERKENDVVNFILTETEDQGHIKIDDEDITALNLDTLRQKISVIPQFNLIMSGTLRSNIDPRNEFTDQEIIKDLRRFRVYNLLSNSSESRQTESQTLIKASLMYQSKNDMSIPDEEFLKLLDMEMEHNGTNLSMGQKQLICILRALIKKPKILLLDEATSNIDQNTDKKIQNIFKEECKNTTILTIAHRIETIAHYDRIVVLEKGKVGEIGTPLELFERKELFYDMVSKNGKEFENKIRSLIEEHQKRDNI